MDLTHDELRYIKSHNQRAKALGSGKVVVTWEGGRIKGVKLEADFLPDLYVETEPMPPAQVDLTQEVRSRTS